MCFFHYCLTGVLLKNGIKTFPAFFENAQLAIVRSLGLGCVPNEPVQKLAQVRICTLLEKQ